MYAVTPAYLASRAAERWERLYVSRSIRKPSNWQRKLMALQALGVAATPDAVNEIIGNESWTRVQCDLCGQRVESAIVLEAVELMHACPACLNLAQDLIKQRVRDDLAANDELAK